MLFQKIFHTQAFAALGTVAAVASLPLMLRVLEPREYGTYVLFQGLLTVLVLLVGQNLFAYARLQIPGRDDHFQYGMLKTVFAMELVVFSGLALLLAVPGSRRAILVALGLDANLAGWLLWILGIEIARQELMRFHLARRNVELKNIAQFLHRFALLLGLAILLTVVGRTDVRGVLMVFAAAQLVASTYLLRGIHPGRLASATLQPELWRRGYRFGLALLPAGFSMVGIAYADRLVVQKLLGHAAVGVYGLPLQLSATIAAVVGSSVVLALFPFLAEAHNAGRHIRRDYYGYFMLRHSAVFSTLFAGFAVINRHWIVKLFGGAAYTDAAVIMTVSAFWPLLYAMGHATSHVLQVARVTRAQAIAYPIVLVVNVALNVMFIRWWGLIGAASASALALAAIASTNLAVVWTTPTLVRVRRWLGRAMLRVAMVAALPALAVFLPTQEWSVGPLIFANLLGLVFLLVACRGLDLISRSEVRLATVNVRRRLGRSSPVSVSVR